MSRLTANTVPDLGKTTPRPKLNITVTESDNAFRPTATGTGTQARGTWSTARVTVPTQAPFNTVTDAKLLNVPQGRASIPTAVQHRNALTEALKTRTPVDVAKVKSNLMALVRENKAVSKESHPTALHLDLGFGKAGARDTVMTSAMVWQLQANAAALRGKLGNTECEQMLGWFEHAWAVHERDHPAPKIHLDSTEGMLEAIALISTPRGNPSNMMRRSSDRPPQMTALLPTTDVEPAIDTMSEVAMHSLLGRAQQRDKLFEAFRNGTVPDAKSFRERLPSMTHLNHHLPAPVPDRFITETWSTAQRHVSQFSLPLQTYIHHCHQLATWHVWVQDHMKAHAESRHTFPVELRGACNTLRSTHEADLLTNAANIEQVLQAALQLPQLAQALAQQPFASLQMMVDKCIILGPQVKSQTVLAAFRLALESALALQSFGIDKLRKALLDETVDNADLKPLFMTAFAWRATVMPSDELGARTTLEQRTTMRKRIAHLLKADLDTSKDVITWDITVLRRFAAGADRALEVKMAPIPKPVRRKLNPFADPGDISDQFSDSDGET